MIIFTKTGHQIHYEHGYATDNFYIAYAGTVAGKDFDRLSIESANIDFIVDTDSESSLTTDVPF